MVDEDITEEGPIEPNKPHDEIRKEPYPLPKDFEWSLVDVDNDQDVVWINSVTRDL